MLLPVLAVLFPQFVTAANYRVDIDDVSRVTLYVGDTEYTDAVNGLNNIDMGGERYLRVKTNDGILFTEVTFVDEWYNEETSWLDRVATFEDGTQYIDLYSTFPEDEMFRIRTSGATEARSASFTLTVDDPSAIVLQRKAQPVELTAGENTVKFDPTTEATIDILTVSKPLYSVTHNGTPVKSDFRYTITVADGDVVDVQAKYPDIDCLVTINVTGGGASDFIATMDIDGKAAFNWDKPFTVKAGTEVTLTGRTTEYEVLSFTINGVSAMFTNPTTIFVDRDATLDLSVRRYASFDMTVNIDDPSRVHVYRGYSYNGDELELQAGDNVVEVTRNTPILSIVPAEGCYLNTMNIDGYNYEPYELQIAPVMVGSLTDDDVLTITTATIVRDKKAMVYVHNLGLVTDYFKFKRGDLSDVAMTEGYNALPFYERDNAFRIETGAPVDAVVYLNDEVIEPQPGGFTYAPNLADGDVVKVFFDFAPGLHDVELSVAAELADGVQVTKDYIRPVQCGTVKATTHTRLTIAGLSDTRKCLVKIDGEEYAELNGKEEVEFTVSDNHKIEVTERSGIAEVAADADVAAEYYTLQGIRLSERPAAGTYIRVSAVKATKVLVK
ncbi:MAG: hypothetical protein K2M55_00830 [Muribaculaceae bacterium]|nr:hypothetical protein [Muribaculaceae bacterium]